MYSSIFSYLGNMLFKKKVINVIQEQIVVSIMNTELNDFSVY